MIRKMLVLLICLFPFVVYADNLLDAYQLAAHYDPTYLKSVAQTQSINMMPAISRAKLLPHISTNASITDSNPLQPHTHSNSKQVTLSMSQTLFNMSDWENYQANKMVAKSAQMNLLAARQDLMVRLAKAYFNVAIAQQTLTIDDKNRLLAEQLYRQAKIKYHAGQVTATDVSTAHANVLGANTALLSDQLTLVNQQVALQAITGQPVLLVAELTLSPRLPMKKGSLRHYLLLAHSTNPSVIASRDAVVAAHRTLQAQKASRLPTLTGTLSYGSSNIGLAGHEHDYNNGSSATLSLNLPLFSGGEISATNKQFAFKLEVAQQSESLTLMGFLTQTRQAYAALVASKTQLRLDQQAVHAAAVALSDTQYSYKAGQEDAQSVVLAQKTLHLAKLTFLKDRYAAVVSQVELLQATGQLSLRQLSVINQQLLHA